MTRAAASRLTLFGFLVLLASSLKAEESVSREAIDIGSRRELFVDRLLIDKLENVAFQMHRPERA